MTDTLDHTAQQIAAQGRDALLARLRPAFERAAAAHADILEIPPERLEQMIADAADRADGLQWRRALAGVAVDQLGLDLGEALRHPAVARAQELLGVPSYEDAFGRTAGAAPASGFSAPSSAPQAPGVGAGEPLRETAPPPSAPSYLEPESSPGYAEPESTPDYLEPESGPSHPEPESAPSYLEPESGPSYLEQEHSLGHPEASSRGESASGFEDEAGASGLSAYLQDPLPPAPAESDAPVEPSAPAEPYAPVEPSAPAEEVPGSGDEFVTADPGVSGGFAGAPEAAAPPAPASSRPYWEVEEEPSERSAGEPLPEPRTPVPPAPPPSFATELEPETAVHAAGGLAGYSSAPAADPSVVHLPAVHLGGIANLAPGETGLELRFADPGLDIAREDDGVLGRIAWEEIRSVEVATPGRLRRRRKDPEAKLVIRTERGDASFRIPGADEDDLRLQLAPALARVQPQA